jgi:hypothetical protein
MKTVRQILWVVLAVLTGVALVAAIRLWVGLPAPSLLPENGLIGARGPLELHFTEEIRPDSLAGRLVLVSEAGETVSGRIEVNHLQKGGSAARFWPDSLLEEGARYAFSLASGVQGKNGLVTRRTQQWQVQVRPGEIVYLSSADTPDLWAALPDGSVPRQITATGGRIYDYDVTSDGEQLIYSALNEQQGIDLWRIGRAGGQPELLLPCQADLCAHPSISPDGRSLVYSRRQVSGLPGQAAGVPNLWLLNLDDLSTNLLLPDPNITGTLAAWSPDGHYLAFNDALQDVLYVADWQAKTVTTYAASQNGALTWFADSRRLFLSRIEGGGSDTRPYIQVFALDAASGQEQQVLGEDFGLYEYSLPVWSPDGGWLAVAQRRVDGGPGKGLWRMHLDGSQAELLSPGDIYTNGAYSWDLFGKRLVFQRVELLSSAARPAVWVWAENAAEPVLVAEDAALPRWLP